MLRTFLLWGGRFRFASGLVLLLFLVTPQHAQQLNSLSVSNRNTALGWTMYPHAEQYRLLVATNLTGPFLADTNGAQAANSWSGSNANPLQFFRLETTPLSSNNLLAAQVLNRLAYGPSPDDWEHIQAIGPQAFINEQLAPETITENLDTVVSVTTNSGANPISNNWVRVIAKGVASGSVRFNLIIYVQGIGDAYVDDIRVVSGADPDAGTNLVLNGDFESPLSSTWTLSANVSGSSNTTERAYSGTSGLRVVSSATGSNQTTAIWQNIAPVLTNGEIVTLSFYYFPSPNSRALTVRLGTGLNSSADDAPGTPTWYYARTTGFSSGNNTIYLYLSGAGVAYIDDVKLVVGSVAEAGVNLLTNGNFETGALTPWQLTADFSNSVVTSELAFSGTNSLKIIASAAGSGSGDAVFQTSIPKMTNGAVYTVSFWYVPATQSRTLTARLSGSSTPGLLTSNPDNEPPGIRRRLAERGAQLHDLRAWHVLNAVSSKRQLLEVLLQFLENHFVTQHAKSVDYLDRSYDDFTLLDKLAADWEYREINKWRNALLNLNCTFYDLLKISAESPAMIVYLDTVDSKGNGSNIANENYARELFELFCMGVDNGYDQTDIVNMSRAWTGWSVDLVDEVNIDNPFAPRSTTYGFYPGSGYSAVSNLVGAWTFNFKSANHGTNRAPIFPGKTVPARFGAPWAGTSYQLNIPARTGTNSIQDGYDVLQHLANLPFTMEYLSVKLCRLFVHEGFPNPSVDPATPEYAFYDYTNPNRTAETELVHQCLQAWWTATPRGNIRTVLNTIFNSDLFRTQAGAVQKVKTPFEFAVSTIRALRAAKPDGTYTADTDGYSIAGRNRTASTAPLTRMGTMMLFDRDAPDGFSELGAPWVNASTLAERVRFVQTTLMPITDAAKTDGITSGNFNNTDPVGLMKLKLPPGSWSDATAIADYFIGLLFAGEGRANLERHRNTAINYLNTADDGITSSPFNALSQSSTNYENRVRGVVSFMMTLDRFEEQ
jgi:uncharacterized protein (DUF1800 family)